MAEPTSDNWLVAALWGCAAFVAGLVAWDRKRSADREDRDFDARKDYTDKLAELPVRLEAIVTRVEALEREGHEIRQELAELRLRVPR